MSKKSFTKKYNISGPVNIIRLTNGTKIVYIFGDRHNPINNQIECPYSEQIPSIRIDSFFEKFFKKNPDKKFDFFYEGFINMHPELIPKEQSNFLASTKFYTDNYFEQIIKLVFNNIKLVDNKIHSSKHFENIRLHYFNFRSIIPHFLYFFNNENNLNDLIFKFKYQSIFNILTDYKQRINEILDFFNKSNNKYIKKIISKYTNKDIKKIILNIYNIYVIEQFKKIIQLIDETISYIQKTPELHNIYTNIDKSYSNNRFIYINILKINNFIKNSFANITDIFLIRRLLDKDYINNCIIYTGTYHMIAISYLLIKYFNFKITHVANSDKFIKYKDINEIFINKNLTEYDDIMFLSYFLDDGLQCSNLFDFPDNLE